MPSVRHRLRQLLLVACALPASFMCYPGWRRWRQALAATPAALTGGGKSKRFFLDVLASADRLQLEAERRGLLARGVVGAPVRFGLRIREQLGTGKALRRLFRRWREGDPFLAPGPVSLPPPPPTDARPLPVQALLLYGEDTLSSTTCVVLSHRPRPAQHGPDRTIAHMACRFRELGWKVVLVTSHIPAGLSRKELAAALHEVSWADGVVRRVGPGSTFADWQAALRVFPSLWDANELILADDSVFGGMGSYAAMHGRMARVPREACDFWGVTELRTPIPHLAPCHLVFRRSALCHPALRECFLRMPMDEAVPPEVRLSPMLAAAGLRAGALCPLPADAPPSVNPLQQHWNRLLERGAPLLAHETLLHPAPGVRTDNWAALAQARNYPLEAAFDWGWRQGLDLTPTCCPGTRSHHWPNDVLQVQRGVVLHETSAEPAPEPPACTPPAGVFLHVYYVDLLPELAAALVPLPRHMALYVSTDSEAKVDAIDAHLGGLGFAGLDVRVLPNRGWDVGPFLVGFADVLTHCPLMVRIHTKRSTHISPQVAAQWRHLLYGSLLGSPQRVRAVFDLFARTPRLGMLCPPHLYHYLPAVRSGDNLETMNRLLAPHHIRLNADTAIDFPMGSMFWCRTAVLRPWLEAGLGFDDFAATAATARDGSLAHALERLFLFGCGLTGHSWGRLPPPGLHQLRPAGSPGA